MEVCGHYERWREDFDCVQEIGINFLRYGPPIHKTYLAPEQVRLGIRRPHLRRAEAARHHADRRSVPLRRSRLAGQFPEPGFPAAVRGLMPASSPSASRGCSSTRRSTRCSFARSSPPNTAGGTSRRRTTARSSPRSSISSKPTSGDDRDPEAPSRRDLHPVGIVRILSRRFARPRSGVPKSSTRCVSCRST